MFLYLALQDSVCAEQSYLLAIVLALAIQFGVVVEVVVVEGEEEEEEEEEEEDHLLWGKEKFMP